jgi:hypothetical protein
LFTTTSVASGGSTTLTAYANTTGLTTGLTYQGTITVTPSTGTALSIPVSFTVGSGGTGNWTVI